MTYATGARDNRARRAADSRSGRSNLRNGTEAEDLDVLQLGQVLQAVGHVAQRVRDQVVQARAGLVGSRVVLEVRQLVAILLPVMEQTNAKASGGVLKPA